MKGLRKIHLREGICKRGKSGAQAPHRTFVEVWPDKACLTCARVCGCDECRVVIRDFGKRTDR